MTKKTFNFLLQLYTAFFKCNIEQKLKDREAIFELLKSLGYTVMEQQKVYIKESERQHVIWASLSLFLVQVDLQVIKQIMDHFSNGEFTLKDIARARSKHLTVEDAVSYLRQRAAKRRKIEESQGVTRKIEESPHGRTKDTHIGRVDAYNNLQSENTSSGVETSADQTTKRPPKCSVLSQGRQDVAADSYDSLTGSAVSKRCPPSGMRTGYKMSFATTEGHHFTSAERFGHVTDQDLYGLSAQGDQPQHHLDARYSTDPQAGTPNDAKKYTSDARWSTFPQTASGSRSDPNQYNVDTRYGTAPQARAMKSSANTKEIHRYHREPKGGHPQFYDSTKDRMDSATTASHSYHTTVTPSHSSHQHTNQSIRGFVRDDLKRYSAANQSATVGALTNPNEYQSKMSARTETQMHGSSSGNARYANLQDISSSADRQFGSNKLDEPMSTKDSVRGRDDRDVRFGQTRGSGTEPMDVEEVESSHDRSDAYSSYNGVREGAYSTANSRVTELNNTLKHQLTLQSSDGVSGKTSEQLSAASSERRVSESITNAHEATEYRDGIPIHGQPSTSTNETGQMTRSSASEIKGRTEVKGSLPVPSWRTAAQRERAQNTAHSSRSDLHKETTLEGSIGSEGHNPVCELCDEEGTIICGNCHLIICRKCKQLYEVDLCGATKGDHAFVELKDSKVQQMKSVDSKASTSHHYVNVYEGFEDQEKDWHCSRCTFLNPPDHKICAMCATTRGVGPVELTEAGSRVCRNCTYHNKENAKVCKACHKTLDLQNPETSV